MLAADVKPALAQISAGTPEVEKIQDRDREHRRRHDRPDGVIPGATTVSSGLTARNGAIDQAPGQTERRDQPARPDRPVRR